MRNDDVHFIMIKRMSILHLWW